MHHLMISVLVTESPKVTASSRGKKYQGDTCSMKFAQFFLQLCLFLFCTHDSKLAFPARGKCKVIEVSIEQQYFLVSVRRTLGPHVYHRQFATLLWQTQNNHQWWSMWAVQIANWSVLCPHSFPKWQSESVEICLFSAVHLQDHTWTDNSMFPCNFKVPWLQSRFFLNENELNCNKPKCPMVRQIVTPLTTGQTGVNLVF